jgi:hypothetical protein
VGCIAREGVWFVFGRFGGGRRGDGKGFEIGNWSGVVKSHLRSYGKKGGCGRNGLISIARHTTVRACTELVW